MKVRDMIEELQKFPPDSSIELSRLLAVDAKDGSDVYEMRLDLPIIGLAHNMDDPESDVLLVVEYVDNDKFRNVFGTLEPFGVPPEVQ